MSNKFPTILYPLISRRMVTLYVCLIAMYLNPGIAQYITFLGASVIGVALSDSIVTKNITTKEEEPKE